MERTTIIWASSCCETSHGTPRQTAHGCDAHRMQLHQAARGPSRIRKNSLKYYQEKRGDESQERLCSTPIDTIPKSKGTSSIFLSGLDERWMRYLLAPRLLPLHHNPAVMPVDAGHQGLPCREPQLPSRRKTSPFAEVGSA